MPARLTLMAFLAAAVLHWIQGPSWVQLLFASTAVLVRVLLLHLRHHCCSTHQGLHGWASMWDPRQIKRGSRARLGERLRLAQDALPISACSWQHGCPARRHRLISRVPGHGAGEAIVPFVHDARWVVVHRMPAHTRPPRTSATPTVITPTDSERWILNKPCLSVHYPPAQVVPSCQHVPNRPTCRAPALGLCIANR